MKLRNSQEKIAEDQKPFFTSIGGREECLMTVKFTGGGGISPPSFVDFWVSSNEFIFHMYDYPKALIRAKNLFMVFLVIKVARF